MCDLENLAKLNETEDLSVHKNATKRKKQRKIEENQENEGNQKTRRFGIG